MISGILSFICILWIFALVVFTGYLFYKNRIIESKLESVVIKASEIEKSGRSVQESYIDEKFEELAKIKSQQGERGPAGERGPQGDMGSMGPPGEQGLRGKEGPIGKSLIVNIDELFTGKDEIDVFKKIQESIPLDEDEINVICSNFTTKNEKKNSISNIKT